jgi:hypothetical protein
MRSSEVIWSFDSDASRARSMTSKSSGWVAMRMILEYLAALTVSFSCSTKLVGMSSALRRTPADDDDDDTFV